MIKRHKMFAYAKELLKTVCLVLRKANVNTAAPWTVFIQFSQSTSFIVTAASGKRETNIHLKTHYPVTQSCSKVTWMS